MTAPDALRKRAAQAVGTLFEIEDEIGRGGMAVVYRARDVRLRRKVALKVLPPELAFREEVKSRFLREAQMSAQLSHPNIVPIYTVDELDGVVFFSMGLVEGETLAQQLARDPRPSVATVRAIMREVADALAYAHARGVVHRDVKPDNILVDRATGHVMVSDFGIARAAEGDARLTVTGVAVGTPAYMSPEQAMGDRDVDGRADIYALGVVGYQMLAGELPHKAANTPSMLMKHISERPRPLGTVRADLPANLVYAIERAMAKGRDDRWPDAAAFRDALAEDAPVPST
ncbi:MAG TPA: serine/threonine-protein kinase, partial [Gemmatimonadaceae bacterium]